MLDSIIFFKYKLLMTHTFTVPSVDPLNMTSLTDSSASTLLEWPTNICMHWKDDKSHT